MSSYYSSGSNLPFHFRYGREIREGIAIAIVLTVYGLYRFVPVIQRIVDKPLNIAVSGLTLGYSKFSTVLHSKTGIDIGLVTPIPDPDFVFRVRVASYTNSRRAEPLLDIGADTRFSDERRQHALEALLRFDSVNEWVQPFLNEVSKGGLLGMYDDHAPVLDQLVQRIRAEGGLRKPLVRAYADQVFSYMLSHATPKIRQHGFNWVNDVMAEDALFLVAPRVTQETDANVQKRIEEALWNVNAVSNQTEAMHIVQDAYAHAAWPEARIPLAYLLVRLGYRPMAANLRDMMELVDLPNDKKLLVSIALGHKPFPDQLVISDRFKNQLAERRQARERQYKVAYSKQVKILTEGQRAAVVAQPTPVVVAALPTKPPKKAKPVEEPLVEMAEVPKTKSTRAAELKQPIEVPVEEVGQEPAVAAVPTPAKPKPTVAPKPTPAKAAPVVKEEPIEEPVVEKQAKIPVVASLPKPPVVEPPVVPVIPPKPQAGSQSMQAIDVVFEVETQEVPLYVEPGYDDLTGVILAVGTKGQASFRVSVGDEDWVQVKSKKGNGWANASLLTMYELSPGGMGGTPPAPPVPDSMTEKAREEATYFQPIEQNIVAYANPSEDGAAIFVLSEGTPYLAVKSEKIGANRWFRLQLTPDLTGWVPGINLQLSNVAQPAAQSANPLSLKGKSSAFAPEWIVAAVKGVGVYTRPSIAGRQLSTIDPKKPYKVLELSEGSGKEWYKIQVSAKESGWVQALDVNLTKAP